MQVSVRTNVQEITKKLTRIQRRQIPFATMMALNETAFGIARQVMPKQAERKFDGGATAFTKRGFKYQKASKLNLESIVYIDKKQLKYMRHQVDGGVRRPNKKVILTPGYHAKINRYGNITRANRTKYLSKSDKYIVSDRGVYEVKGKGKSQQLKKVLNFVKQAKYSPKFHFYRMAEGYINNPIKGFNPRMSKHLARAIANAK